MILPSLEWVDLPTGRASFLQGGARYSGNPIVLLHGGGFDCATLSWRLLFPELAANRHVIAINWPGYGGSDALGRNHTIADLGEWLTGLLDVIAVERASFVGISMGGGAALWMAIHQPDRVERIVPVATYGIAARGPYHELSYLITRLPLNRWSFALMRRCPSALSGALRKVFKDPRKVTPGLASEVLRVLTESADGRSFTEFQRGEMGRHRLRTVLVEQLSSVIHPTLFIHGDADILVPWEAVKRASGLMPNAACEIHSAGHWPMRECPDEFNQLVRRFLSDNGDP